MLLVCKGQKVKFLNCLGLFEFSNDLLSLLPYLAVEKCISLEREKMFWYSIAQSSPNSVPKSINVLVQRAATPVGNER